MKRLRYLLLAFVGCVGCSSSDGGPVGTGVASTATISGNVVYVQPATARGANQALAELPPIQISIDGRPTLRTVADVNGNFVLDGHFAGSVTMRFAVPQFEVTQQLDVPAGSTVVLQDIDLQPDGVVVQAARQLNFLGMVDFSDCSDGTLLIHEQRPGGQQYHVHLDEQSSVVDAAGQVQTCAAIQVGSTVAVEGTITHATPDGTITALVVTVSPLLPPPSQQQFEARYWGAVAVVDCSTRFVVVDDAVQRTTIQLTDETRLSAGLKELTCPGLHLGDRVYGKGGIALHMPGIIVAATLDVIGPPSADQSLRVVGFVTRLGCVAGLIEINNEHASIHVLLSDMTVITRDNQLSPCAGIQLGDRIVGVGRLAAGSRILEAARMTVRDP